ncbi:MAG: hypothetical protein ABI554_06130 [Flavobacterium sp.]
MENKIFIKNENSKKLSSILARKIKKGFVVEEVNNKLPFVVLSRKPVKVNHRLNFFMSCVTFGLWSLPWIYQSYQNREKKILIAIDEDGNAFEEKCYN